MEGNLLQQKYYNREQLTIEEKEDICHKSSNKCVYCGKCAEKCPVKVIEKRLKAGMVYRGGGVDHRIVVVKNEAFVFHLIAPFWVFPDYNIEAPG